MINRIQVSIVIVNYRSADLLEDCLHSIYYHTHNVSFEVIVVNNSPEDSTREMLARAFPQVIYLPAENNGFGAANNIGAASAKGDSLFFLNPDTLLLSNTLPVFVEFLENNKAAGACGCALVNANLTAQVSYGRFQSIWSLIFEVFLRKIFPAYYRSNLAMDGYVDKQEEPFCVDYVTGADLFIKKTTFDKVGGFDKNFFLYFEETDLCYRLIEQGYKNMILPDQQIVHLCGQTTAQVPSQRQIEWFETSRYLFIKKTKTKGYALLFRYLDLLFVKMALILKPGEYWKLKLNAIKKAS